MKSVNIKIPRIKRLRNLMFNCLLCIFFVMKMQRSFSGSKVEGGIWNYIQVLFVVIGIVCVVKNIDKIISERVLLSLFLYTFFVLINGLFFVDFQIRPLFNYLMMAYPLCILVLSCRVACFDSIEKNWMITIAYYLMAIIYIFCMLKKGSYSTTIGAVADVYYILGLLPLMIIWQKKYYAVPFIFCGLALLLSGKRTGIVLFVVMVLIFCFSDIFITRKQNAIVKMFVRFMIFIIVFLNALKSVNSNFNLRLVSRIERMILERDTSGRDVLWIKTINAFKESEIIYWIFGHGEGALSSAIGYNAHNDYLEILYNFGVLPMVLYASFYIMCIRQLIKMIRMKYEYSRQFLMAVICSLGLSFFSFYAIDPTYITSGMLCIGYILVDYKKRYYPKAKILRIR